MNKIIAPVDFSDDSLNAARYAANMAALLNKDLMLLHVLQLPVVYGDVPMPVGEYSTHQEEAQAEMDKMVKLLDAEMQGQVIIHDVIKIGSPAYELIQLGKLPSTYATVIASHGAGAMERFFLGSTTLSLIKESEHPVIVVPTGYHFRKPKKVGLACDFKNVVEDLPEKTIRMVIDDLGAQLEILHSDPNYTEYEPAVMEEGLMLDTMFEVYKPTFQFLHSGYTEEAILNYAHDNDIDMLIIMPKEHSMVESMFKHQHTRSFVQNATVPIMVIRCPHK